MLNDRSQDRIHAKTRLQPNASNELTDSKINEYDLAANSSGRRQDGAPRRPTKEHIDKVKTKHYKQQYQKSSKILDQLISENSSRQGDESERAHLSNVNSQNVMFRSGDLVGANANVVEEDQKESQPVPANDNE